MAKVTIDFKGRKYTYTFIYPENPTMHNLALAMAVAKSKRDKVTKYTGMPKDYNLFRELLSNNARIVYTKDDPANDVKLDHFADASQRNSEEKPFKKTCVDCTGSLRVKPKYKRSECPTCKGYGYLIQRLRWRVGLTQSRTHIIDIDGLCKDNLYLVKSYYESVLGCKFKVIQSNKGYWLVSLTKYDSLSEWLWAHCKVLNPKLQKHEMVEYIEGLKQAEGTGLQFKKMSSEDFKKSSFYNGVGDFDVLFTLLSIKRERSTIRISKKKSGDKIIVVPDGELE